MLFPFLGKLAHRTESRSAQLEVLTACNGHTLAGIHGLRTMDVEKILKDLRTERQHIEEAIITLERLARGRGNRRGRPPAWMAEIRRGENRSGAAPNRRADHERTAEVA